MALVHRVPPKTPATDTLQYFLVDLNNNGSYYQVGIFSDNKDDTELALTEYFRDVRFMYERKKKNRDKVIGKRVLSGDMMIGYCKYCYDINNTFSKFKVDSPPDRRHRTG